MKFFTLLTCYFIFLHLSVLTKAESLPSDLSIQDLVESIQQNKTNKILHEIIFSDSLLPAMYQENKYEPLWTSAKNILDLIWLLDHSHHDGLLKEDYHWKAIHKLLKEQEELSLTEKCAFDILLTDALILYSSHLIWGKVNPSTLESSWNFKTKAVEKNTYKVVLNILNQESLLQTIHSIRPDGPTYLALMKALHQYEEIAKNGGWKKISSGSTIHLNETDKRIPQIRERLKMTGDLFPIVSKRIIIDTSTAYLQEQQLAQGFPLEEPEITTTKSIIPYEFTPVYDSTEVYDYTFDTTSLVMDENLQKSIYEFQLRHGIESDGNIGKGTIEAMNISVEDKIEAIKVNMERVRWLHDDVNDYFVLVNIAGYTLYAQKYDQWEYTTKVMVGLPYHQTPVFTAPMQYIEFNPTWTVPYSIASKELLPSIKKDPGYISRKGMELLSPSGKVLDPLSIDWSQTSKSNFPYILRQKPGATNALGFVKLIFPNPHSVYLHDTPSRYLFVQAQRAFSHGCIRVENPLDFARILIGDEKNYSQEKINEIIKKGETHRYILKESPKVLLVYLTCIPELKDNEPNRLYFYPDIYKRDKTVLKELEEPARKSY